MADRRILLVVGSDGGIAGGLCSAAAVVLADVSRLDVSGWYLYRVGWNALPAESRPDHAETRVVEFVRGYRVEAIVAERVAPSLRNTLDAIGVPVFERGGISARAAAVSAAAVLNTLNTVHRASDRRSEDTR